MSKDKDKKTGEGTVTEDTKNTENTETKSEKQQNSEKQTDVSATTTEIRSKSSDDKSGDKVDNKADFKSGNETSKHSDELYDERITYIREDGTSDKSVSGDAKNEEANTTASEQTIKTSAQSTEQPIEAASAPQKGDVIPEEDDDDEDDEEIIAATKCEGIEKQIATLIATGHMFKAHTIAKKAFNKDPENKELAQAYALVLLKTGAVDECKNMVYKILGVQPQLDEATGNMMLLVEDLCKSPVMKEESPELLSGIGLIFKESWKYSHHCRDLELSRELYLASFNRDKQTSTGMNAAWLSWLTGDDAQAKKLAADVLKLLPPYGLEASFGELIDLAEAQLLLGREDDACKLYEEAMKQRETVNYIAVVTARQQLYFLRDAGFKVPNQALEILVPPTIVVFTGHAIDHPSFQTALFPPDIENDVKRIITEKLKEIDAKIGYSSASCGADIIFIEALQSLGGEINIILPFSISDFIETNVRHAGPRWEKRFEKVLATAHTVSFACEDKYLGHDMLYRFSNHVMHGSAVMRGKFLTTEPHLMAVWHSRTESLPGGPADFIDRWSNISTLHLIDLDEISNSDGAVEKIDPTLVTKQQGTISFDPFISKSPDRVIKSMMFSDLSGYSKLQDEHIPSFLDFLDKLNKAMEKIGMDLESLNTWGDAVFAVADSAIKIADFGLRYCDIIESLGKKYPEFPFPIRARISLHSGPVFIAMDPFIKKMNFYGGHINRAARLEPVTTVGQVYATQQFVALLHGETNDERNEYIQRGLKYYERYSTEYVGMIALAKSFGQQEVYHLRWS